MLKLSLLSLFQSHTAQWNNVHRYNIFHKRWIAQKRNSDDCNSL